MVLIFLRAWIDARPALLNALSAAAVAAAAAAKDTSIASTLSVINGETIYTAPADTSGYKFDPNDAVAAAAAGSPTLAALSAPLAQCCMCLLAGPASAPSTGVGPVPPARELLALSVSAAAAARIKQGLPLLDPALLSALCNSTRNATAEAREGIGGCQPLQFEWDGKTATLLPCNLTWEPRLLEQVVARCLGLEYFGSRVAANAAAAAAAMLNSSRTVRAAAAASAAAAAYTVSVSKGALLRRLPRRCDFSAS